MFILHFDVDVKFIILYIKTGIRNNPSMTCVAENVLMKIPNTIGIGLIYLTETFIFNCMSNRFAVDFSIKSQLNRINDIFIELVNSNFTSIGLNGLFDVFVYIFVRNKAEVVSVHHNR